MLRCCLLRILRGKFEDMIKIKYLPESNMPGSVSTTIDIQRVSLELFRITEQNSIENGLLVPVWNFYGTKNDRV